VSEEIFSREYSGESSIDIHDDIICEVEELIEKDSDDDGFFRGTLKVTLTYEKGVNNND